MDTIRVNKRVNSITEFVGQIEQLSQHLNQNGITCYEIPLFRGQPDTEYELLPSLGRERSSSCSISLFNEERNLIDYCKYRMPDVFQRNFTPLELLSLLQHYGIPTRLLDVTENALVALYFACSEKPDKDGEVFAFKCNEQAISVLPIIEGIADTYRLVGINNSDVSLKNYYKRLRLQPYFLEQRVTFDTVKNLRREGFLAFNVKSYDEYLYRVYEKPLFVFAPIHNLRQQIQCGRYILFSNAIEKNKDNEYCFKSIIKPLSKDHESIIARYIIPHAKKNEIISQLKLFGISRDKLFGDSTDIVCNSIKEYFQYRQI